MAFEDDMADLNADVLNEFGQSVTYEQAPAAPFTLTVILEYPGELEDTSPAYRRISVRLSDFGAPRQTPANGDFVTVDGVIYQVQKVGPNKAGMVSLTLNQTNRDPNA